MSFEKDAVIIEAKTTQQASVIWLHGLGANGHDFEPIVPELNLPDDLGIRFIFPNAPIKAVTINNGMQMPAWYDIKSMNLREMEDADCINSSSNIINAYIQAEMDAGIPSAKILLAGFSQGGVIALHTGLRYPQPLAGIIALSTYLALPQQLSHETSESNKSIPIFMAHGIADPIIPVEQGRDSCDQLKQAGYPVDWNEYTMQHAVCLQEIEAIGSWIKDKLA